MQATITALRRTQRRLSLLRSDSRATSRVLLDMADAVGSGIDVIHLLETLMANADELVKALLDKAKGLQGENDTLTQTNQTLLENAISVDTKAAVEAFVNPPAPAPR